MIVFILSALVLLKQVLAYLAEKKRYEALKVQGAVMPEDALQTESDAGPTERKLVHHARCATDTPVLAQV